MKKIKVIKEGIIKSRVEDMIEFHKRRKVLRHKSKKDYSRKNKQWKIENE